jgi:ABC-type glycerol-3-phosphate transport system substrate-binding protein
MKRLLAILLLLTMTTAPLFNAVADDKVTISFQTWNPGDDVYIHKIIDQFEAENPNIKVEFIFMPYSDHIADMQIKMNNGEGPDIYGMQTGATYNTFREYEVDLTPYAVDSWGEGWESKFLEFCLELVNVQDKYYGLPLGLTYAGFVWADVEKLTSLGLEVPKNFDELKAVTKVLRENNELPLLIGAKDAWINIDTWMNIANDINAEKLYDAIDGKTSFTDADLVQSFEIWQSLFTEGIVQDGALGVNMYTDTTDIWENGQGALALNGSWATGIYVTSDPVKYEVFNHEGADHDIFLMDWNNDGKPAGVAASIDVVLCMNSNSQHKDEAWKFIDYMLHEGQDILINEGMQYNPSRTDFVLNVEGLSADGTEALDYIIEQSKTNIAGYREMPYAELKLAISEALAALATNEMTPDDAAKYVEDASQAQKR